MKKAIVIDFSLTKDDDMLYIKEEFSNFLLSRKMLIKVLDHAHIYTQNRRDDRVYYAGDVVLLSGSRIIISIIDSIWGRGSLTGPFDKVHVDYERNKIEFKKSSWNMELLFSHDKHTL